MKESNKLSLAFRQETKKFYEDCFKELQQMNPKLIETIGFSRAKKAVEVSVMAKGLQELV